MRTAGEVMSSPAERIEESASVREAILRMRSKGVSSLLVAPARGDGALGFVSEADVVTKVVAEGLDPDAVRVADVTSRPVISVPPSTSLEDCARLLRSARVRRVLVDDGEDIVGIVSTSDILAELFD
jgi:isocitrate dehydrogenase